MVMVTCEKCFYPLKSGQAKCPECNHPVSQSLSASITRGVHIEEAELRVTMLRSWIVFVLIMMIVLALAARLSTNFVQSKVLFAGSAWGLGIAMAAIGLAVPWLLGFMRLMPCIIGAWFVSVGAVLLWWGPAFPNSARPPAMLLPLAGAITPIAVGVALVWLSGLFPRLRLTPVRMRSAAALMALGVITVLGVVFRMPTEQGSRGLIVVANVAAIVFSLREVARLIVRLRNAIPAPPGAAK